MTGPDADRVADVRPPGTTPGLVCAHHHLYSTLARRMPAPPRTPAGFNDILELVWWRLDRALDLESIRWSAMLGAVEALERGCTAIIDHHESPEAIDGSLDVIAEACAEVGVRVSCAYGITDRHGTDGARRGLAENERYLRAGGRGMVGVHAAFTCTDGSLEAAAAWPRTSAWASTSTWLRATPTWVWPTDSVRWPPTTGCWSTAFTCPTTTA